MNKKICIKQLFTYGKKNILRKLPNDIKQLLIIDLLKYYDYKPRIYQNNYIIDISNIDEINQCNNIFGKYSFYFLKDIEIVKKNNRSTNLVEFSVRLNDKNLLIVFPKGKCITVNNNGLESIEKMNILVDIDNDDNNEITRKISNLLHYYICKKIKEKLNVNIENYQYNDFMKTYKNNNNTLLNYLVKNIYKLDNDVSINNLTCNDKFIGCSKINSVIISNMRLNMIYQLVDYNIINV